MTHIQALTRKNSVKYNGSFVKYEQTLVSGGLMKLKRWEHWEKTNINQQQHRCNSISGQGESSPLTAAFHGYQTLFYGTITFQQLNAFQGEHY